MHYESGHMVRKHTPIRWMAYLIVFAIVGAMSAPIATVGAQTPASSGEGGLIDIAPASSIVFAQANLDMSSDQAQQATELFERAGLDNILEDQSLDDSAESLPANAQVALVVTSLPDTASLDVADVSVDPLSASESLDEGGFAVAVAGEGVDGIYQSEVSRLNDDAEFNGGEVVESEYGSVTITSLEPAADDMYTDPVSLAMVGDVFVISMAAEDIHPIIDTFNGELEGLATNEEYQTVFELLPSEYIGSGFINGPAMLAEIEASDPDALEGIDEQALANANTWTGFTFSAEDQGFRLESRSIPAAGELAELTPIDGAFFDSVPANAVFATSGTNIDSNGVVTMLALVFASALIGEDLTATPVADVDLATAQDEVFTRAESLLGFNLKTDLIDNLVGEFGIAVTIGDLTADLPEVDAIVVSDVQNPTVVQDAISKIAFIVGAALGDQAVVDSRDVNGSTVNVVDLGDTEFDTKVEFGVVGDEVIVSVGNGLDDYVNGPAAPLSEDPNFQAVLELMPSEYGSLTYVNMPVLTGLVMELSASFSGSMVDADPSCGEFASQAEAQAAYDEDQFENFMLDQDFDGEACEDYFSPSAATPTAVENPYSNVLGLATVTTQENGVNGTTTFLLIGE